MKSEILKAVAGSYGITVEQLTSKSRKRPLPDARKMAVLFLVDKAQMKGIEALETCRIDCYNGAGKYIRKIRAHIELYDDVKDHYERITDALK